MIPAPFDYVRASTVEHAVTSLAEHGDEAKVLAGGHSLLPLMKLRLAFPTVLVDIGRIDELRGVEDDGDEIVIGAATSHDEVMHDPLVLQHCGVLAEATATVADPQVRHRGTIGGALAHGDAAGDLPAVAVALGATLQARSPRGTRTIAAADFFVDYLETVLAPDELVTSVRVPKHPAADGWGWRYEKFARASHMWATVGVCAVVRTVDRVMHDVRIGLTNMGPVPHRAAETERALTGAAVGDVAAAADLADEGTRPPSDIHATDDYRRHLARVLTRRAVLAATS